MLPSTEIKILKKIGSLSFLQLNVTICPFSCLTATCLSRFIANGQPYWDPLVTDGDNAKRSQFSRGKKSKSSFNVN